MEISCLCCEDDVKKVQPRKKFSLSTLPGKIVSNFVERVWQQDAVIYIQDG